MTAILLLLAVAGNITLIATCHHWQTSLPSVALHDHGQTALSHERTFDAHNATHIADHLMDDLLFGDNVLHGFGIQPLLHAAGTPIPAVVPDVWWTLSALVLPLAGVLLPPPDKPPQVATLTTVR